MRVQARKIGVKRLIRDEKGYILILALLVLVVVGLISGPVLSYMVSGLRAGHIFETGAAELYAADAGAEEAVWKIQNQVDIPTGCGGDLSRSYNISGVNGKKVDFTITRANNVTQIYHVISTATSDGSGTKIDAYIVGTSVYGDFSGMTNQVITSLGEINFYPEKGWEEHVSPSSGNNSPAEGYPPALWPPADVLSAWYMEDVKGLPSDSRSSIDLNGNDMSLGPLYRVGPLDIKSSNTNKAATLTLNGTLYITGDTKIYGPTNEVPSLLTIKLNGHTIFVWSNSPKYALEITKCNIEGPGVIIAVGGIYFAPKAQVGTAPVFILSVEGKTLLQPGGDFYGSIAGGVEVDFNINPASNIVYPGSDAFGGFNFPGLVAGRFIYSIDSWEVSRL